MSNAMNLLSLEQQELQESKMPKIKIQTIAQGSKDFGKGLTDLINAYEKFEEVLKEQGKAIKEQKINHFPLEGCISAASADGTYFFRDCLVENKFVPTFFDGNFHVVGIAGQPSRAKEIAEIVKNFQMPYAHCTKEPIIYDAPDNFDISKFKLISDLEKFLQGENDKRKT